MLAAGYKYNMTDMEAALGLPQLPLLEERWARREKLWHLYDEKLKDVARVCRRSRRPKTGTPTTLHAIAGVGEAVGGSRQIVAAMEAENIGVGIHYQPVHRSRSLSSDLAGKTTIFPTRHTSATDDLVTVERGHVRRRCA